MSKSVSKPGAQDVLSSVRRLVDSSDGHKKAATSDRLVLSPQLRVADASVLRLEPKHAVKAVDPNEDDQTSVETPRSSQDSTLPTAPVRKTTTSAQATTPPTGGTKIQHDTAPRAQEKPRSFGVNELTAKIAALETAIARTADQWEPDGISRDAYAGTQSQSMSWVDSIELDARGKPVNDGLSLREAEPAQEKVADQGVGEDKLRDLVAEIVRSELQGPLGERMTRNVRKLVRREINRALAARDFE